MTALERMAGELTKGNWKATWRLGLDKSKKDSYFAIFKAANRSQKMPLEARMTFEDQSDESISLKKVVKLFAHHYCLQMFGLNYSPYAKLDLTDFLMNSKGTLAERIEKANAWGLEGAQWVTGVYLLNFYPLDQAELKYVLATLHQQRINQSAALNFCSEIFGASEAQRGYGESLSLSERLKLFFYLRDSTPAPTLGASSLKSAQDFVPQDPFNTSRYRPHRTNMGALFHHYAFCKEDFEALSAEAIKKLYHAGPLPDFSELSYEATVRGLRELPRVFSRLDFSESSVSLASDSMELSHLLKRLTELLDGGEALQLTASMRASGHRYEAYGAGLFNLSLSGYLFRYAYGRLTREKFLALLRLRAFKLVDDLDFWVRLVESFAEDELSEEELRLALHLL